MSYDRYSLFRNDGEIKIVPFGKIRKADTDGLEVYKRGQTRLDLLSYKYYGDANYAWLIMQANPQVGSMEYEIPDSAVLRIPYPLEDAITSYEESIKRYNKLNK